MPQRTFLKALLKEPTGSSERNPTPASGLLALSSESVALLGMSLLVASILIAPDLRSELRPGLAAGAEPWLSTAVILPAAALLILLLPAALTRLWFLLRPRHRLLAPIAVSLAFLGFTFLLADHALFQRFGRHVGDVLVYLGLPHGGAAAGGTGSVLLLASVVLLWSALCTFGYHWLGKGTRLLLARAQPLFQGLTAATALLASAALAGSLWFVAPLLPGGLGPRLYASLAVRPASLYSGSDYRPADPSLGKLQVLFRAEYRRLYPFIFKRHALTQAPPTPLSDPPDIALIVAESLRWDQLTEERMPRLFAWSKKGLRRTRHYAASNHSETGLFILLYGESALRFNSTLDQRVDPTLCRLLRPSGYRCGYYTGHPKIWLRREEFLNPKTIDDFVHDEEGTWNDWDKKALENSSRHLADKKRRLSLTFLMSSHYEYRYPEAYRKHLPDTPPSTGWLPGQARPEEFVACRNRYRNVTGYLDDLVADYVESLDPERTLILFTGDHGESTGENGHFGHGYAFIDPLTRVPLVMVGPGIKAEVRDELSSHQDVLPTLLDVLKLGARPGTLGQPLAEISTNRPLLSTYTTVGRPIADALLVVGALRLKLRIDPARPDVDVLGFEDADGRPTQPKLEREQMNAIIAAFKSQLELAGHPVH